MDAVLHLCRYLSGTRQKGIMFHRYADRESHGAQIFHSASHPKDPEKLHPFAVWADSDYAGSETRHSTSAHVILLNGGPVGFRGALNKIMTLSTADAELLSAAEAAKEVIHIRLMMKEFGFPQFCDAPTVVYEDNQACIALAHNLRSRKSAKHMEVRLRFLQEQVQAGIVRFAYVRTKEQLADLFTKALPAELFVYLRDRFMHDCL